MARTARTHRLTALAVRRYANDPQATAPLHDGGGLYLRKRGTSLTWVLRLTDPGNGSQQWHRLFPDNPSGSYPHKSLADARQEANRLWTTRSSGIDPRAAAESVTRSDLLGVLDAVKAEGKLRTANILFSDLEQMFRFALARDIVQRNPLDTVTKRDVGGKSVERDRVLSLDELCLLDVKLPSSGLQERFVCATWLTLATGARVGEMLGATWADARHRGKRAPCPGAGQRCEVRLRGSRSADVVPPRDQERARPHDPPQ